MTALFAPPVQALPLSRCVHPMCSHLLARTAVVGALLLSPTLLIAQGSVSPSVHWGAQFLPDLSDRFDVSLSVVGFTRFGKDTVTDGLGRTRYAFLPYNDMSQTLGINLLTFSRTRTGGRFGAGEESVSSGPLTTRSTLSVGFVDDHFAEFLQNNFAHANRLRGRRTLYDIPRHADDVPGSNASVSSTRSFWPPVVALSQEYFLRLYSIRDSEGAPVRAPTPLYIGGGWQVGTLNSEVFLDVGANVTETDIPKSLSLGLFSSLGLGAAVRSGVLRQGHFFADLTGSFVNMQMVGRLKASVKGFSADIDYSLTSAHGFFVRRRDVTQLLLIEAYAPQTRPASRYEAKSGVNELFSSMRLRVGGFTFEVNNDSPGGKDKGPSFAAHVGYSLYQPGRRVPLVDDILGVLSGHSR